MDPITRAIASAAAGAAAGEATYVDDVFSTFLYEGNNSTNVINNGIDLSGEGGLVWIKNRDYFFQHYLVDTERGATKYLSSNGASGESTAANTVPSFSSTGFTTGTDNGVNYSASGQNQYVSWTFRKAPGFFDVVTYTGDGTAGRTVSHNLGSVPGMIFIKDIGRTQNWRVYHRSNGANYSFFLNGSNGTALRYDDVNAFNDTEPTSTVFTVGNDSDVNTFGQNYIAYLFAHDDQSFGTDSDEAIIKCGSYTGNGSATGPEIDLGFEPQFLMVKISQDADDLTGPWIIQDAMRNGEVTSNVTNGIYANTSGAESTTAPNLGVTATGFQPRSTSSYVNRNGSSYVYMAIRRPNKPPEVGTDVFAVDTRGGTSPTPPTFYSGFPVDLVTRRDTYLSDWTTRTRLTGDGRSLQFNNSNAESTGTQSAVEFDQNNGVGSNTGVDSNNYAWMFKRAPGFFDVVAYSGSSSVQNIPHNLQVEPELMIIKIRGRSFNWEVYNKPSGNTKYLQLNSTNGHIGNPAPHWNQTTPTSTHFTVGTNAGGVNYNGDTHIAYLFASLDGISKVGSYSGTGSNINVDCGFTAGARFVLIKQTEPAGTGSSGDWYVWDTTRGIVSGNDPYLLINSTAAQVTNTDYIDPLNAGFTVTSSAPAALNTSGGTYLFLAIA